MLWQRGEHRVLDKRAFLASCRCRAALEVKTEGTSGHALGRWLCMGNKPKNCKFWTQKTRVGEFRGQISAIWYRSYWLSLSKNPPEHHPQKTNDSFSIGSRDCNAYSCQYKVALERENQSHFARIGSMSAHEYWTHRLWMWRQKSGLKRRNSCHSTRCDPLFWKTPSVVPKNEAFIS
jgi:hypothetical protein